MIQFVRSIKIYVLGQIHDLHIAVDYFMFYVIDLFEEKNTFLPVIRGEFDVVLRFNPLLPSTAKNLCLMEPDKYFCYPGTCGDILFTKRDLRRLEKGQWANQDVVDFGVQCVIIHTWYLHTLKTRSFYRRAYKSADEAVRTNVTLLSSHLYLKLTQHAWYLAEHALCKLTDG